MVANRPSRRPSFRLVRRKTAVRALVAADINFVLLHGRVRDICELTMNASLTMPRLTM